MKKELEANLLVHAYRKKEQERKEEALTMVTYELGARKRNENAFRAMHMKQVKKTLRHANKELQVQKLHLRLEQLLRTDNLHINHMIRVQKERLLKAWQARGAGTEEIMIVR